MAISLVQHRAAFSQALIAVFSDDKAPLMGLSAFFPTVTSRAKYLSIQVERHRQLMAVDVQRCTDPHRNIFSKSTEKIFEPPFFSESFDFTSCQGYDITFGANQAPNGATVDMMMDESTRYMLSLKYKIQRAIEKQRADVLQTGIVTIVNGDSIDYRRQASSMVTKTSTEQWNEPTTANPMGDLETGAKFLREQGLSVGSAINVVMGSSALTNFLANDKVRAAAAIFNQIRRIDIGMPQFDGVTGFVFQGKIGSGDYMFNIWTYNDFYELSNGTKTTYIAPNNVIMVPDDFVGKTAYAGIPTYFEEGGAKSIRPVEAEFLVYDLVDQVKMSWDFLVKSAPLVIPISVDKLYTITTVAP